MNFSVFLKGCISFMWPLFLRECLLVELLNILESSLIEILNLLMRFKVQFKVAVNVSGGEQTFTQIMADFSLFVH